MKYKVHKLDIHMSKDREKLESFLNSLDGEIVAIIPNVSIWIYWIHRVNFLFVVEKVT